MSNDIQGFLAGDIFAVVGASRNRQKYGNKVLRCYLQNGRTAYPVNPAGGTIEGIDAVASLAELPEKVHGVSVIVPPDVTEQIVEEAGALGIKHLWMQPGAESQHAIDRANELGMNVIAGGPCLLVALGYRET